MPKVFSEEDRAAIRGALLDSGKTLFLRYGLRKTNVEQLTRAAGIAKGTFYSFFESKEDLCLAIFDQEEEELRGNIASILSENRDAAETLEALMNFSFAFVKSNSLLNLLRESGEYSLLVRGVGRERLSAHLDHDVELADYLLADLRSKGVVSNLDPKVLAGILRAIFMLTLHTGEIGAEVFPSVMELIVRWVSVGIVKGGAE